jgi:hypothetical protein
MAIFGFSSLDYKVKNTYRMRAITTSTWYKQHISGPKIEEFPFFCTKIVCNTNRSTIKTKVKKGVKNIKSRLIFLKM